MIVSGELFSVPGAFRCRPLRVAPLAQNAFIESDSYKAVAPPGL
jgi:hypothetical protein